MNNEMKRVKNVRFLSLSSFIIRFYLFFVDLDKTKTNGSKL